MGNKKTKRSIDKEYLNGLVTRLNRIHRGIMAVAHDMEERVGHGYASDDAALRERDRERLEDLYSDNLKAIPRLLLEMKRPEIVFTTLVTGLDALGSELDKLQYAVRWAIDPDRMVETAKWNRQQVPF